MLHWEIDGKKRWLCRECTRMNTPVFLNSPARLLAAVDNSDQPCSCCGRLEGREQLRPSPPDPPPVTPNSFGVRLQKLKSAWQVLPAWLSEGSGWGKSYR